MKQIWHLIVTFAELVQNVHFTSYHMKCPPDSPSTFRPFWLQILWLLPEISDHESKNWPRSLIMFQDFLYIRHHARDVYLGMCQVQNGVPILMYYGASVKLAKQQWQRTIKGIGRLLLMY